MKIKSLTLAAVLALASSSALAQWMPNEPAPAPVFNAFEDSSFENGLRTEQGTWLFGGNMFIDPATAMGTDIKAEVIGGHYIMYGFMVGAYGAIQDNDWLTTYALGATCKWHFFDDEMSPFSLFCGGDLGFAKTKTVTEDATAFTIGGRVGLDFYLTRNAAVETAFNLHLATSDIYTDKNGLTNVDFTITIGFVFLY